MTRPSFSKGDGKNTLKKGDMLTTQHEKTDMTHQLDVHLDGTNWWYLALKFLFADIFHG